LVNHEIAPPSLEVLAQEMDLNWELALWFWEKIWSEPPYTYCGVISFLSNFVFFIWYSCSYFRRDSK